MSETALTHRVPNYYDRIDRLLSLALWVGLASALGLPFFVSMTLRDAYLFYALIALDAVVGIWAYNLGGRPLGMNKYYVTVIVNMVVTLGQLLLLGASGVYFFYPFILVQLISCVTLFRYRFVALELLLVSIASLYLFVLTDSFELGVTNRLMIGSLFMGSIILITLFLYLAFRQVTQMLLAVEEVKSEFIQDASHELRTPLTVIKAVNQLLKDLPPTKLKSRTKSTMPMAEVLTHLDSATTDLEHITEKLNASSKTRMQWPGLMIFQRKIMVTHFNPNATSGSVDKPTPESQT